MKKVSVGVILILIVALTGCSNINEYSKDEETEHVHTLVDTSLCLPGTYKGYNDIFSCEKVFKCECGYTENMRSQITEKEYREYLLTLKWNKFDFDDAERYPNKHQDGKNVAVVGRVCWVNFYMEDEDEEYDTSGTEIGLYLMDETTLNYTNNYIVVIYPMSFNIEIGRILEGDEIVILGEEMGAYMYTSIQDKQITAPAIYAGYIIMGSENIRKVKWKVED